MAETDCHNIRIAKVDIFILHTYDLYTNAFFYESSMLDLS